VLDGIIGDNYRYTEDIRYIWTKVRDMSQFRVYLDKITLLDSVSVISEEITDMAKWRSLDDYSPIARLLVEYMWAQRPPLLPNQFAQRMGVRKQQVSNWLNSDASPSPSVIVRLARGMGRPVSELFIAAGYASPDDPLFDIEETWTHVLTAVQATPEFLALAEPQQILVIGVLHAAHLRDRAHWAAAIDASEERLDDGGDTESDEDNQATRTDVDVVDDDGEVS
jgi:transcriptional regulator with XRE-family HTH domain